MASIRLAFDTSLGRYGSKEHYFHFLWGYALPAISLVWKLKEDKKDPHFVLDDCGPLMNTVLLDLIKFTESKCSIVNGASDDSSVVFVPRWDIFLLYENIKNKADSSFEIISALQKNKKLESIFMERDFFYLFAKKVKSVREWIIDKTCHSPGSDNGALSKNPSAMFIQKPRFKESNSATWNSYLILERSPEPNFYSRNGCAEIKTYGKSRRSLVNTVEASKSFRKRGLVVTIYEPGKHSVYHQVSTFYHCKGIIGIKGAEFANLVWMQPGSLALIIKPPEMMHNPPVQQNLSRLLEIKVVEIMAEDEFPDLISFGSEIERYLTSAEI